MGYNIFNRENFREQNSQNPLTAGGVKPAGYIAGDDKGYGKPPPPLNGKSNS